MIARRSFLAAAIASLATSRIACAIGDSQVPENLDHMILGCNDLEKGINYLERLSGYKAVFGGSHPGRGTRNALLKMGPDSYLEILAPDPQQKELTKHQDLVSITEPLLVGYAIHQKNLESYAEALRKRGIACEGPLAGSRMRPDGKLLRWKTLSYQDDCGGLLPFFIDWDEHSPHPSSDAPGAMTLLSFHRTGHLLEQTTAPAGKHRIFLPSEPVQLQARLSGTHGEFELVSRSIPSEEWSTESQRP
jgi:hypothetical protein